MNTDQRRWISYALLVFGLLACNHVSALTPETTYQFDDYSIKNYDEYPESKMVRLGRHRWIPRSDGKKAQLFSEGFTVEEYDIVNSGKRLRIEGTEVGTSLDMPWQFPLTAKFMKWGCFDPQRFRGFTRTLAENKNQPSEKIYYFGGIAFTR
ncbi:MAG: hypothetical protein RH917_03035 [Lacipirellulaceae bacterium]